MGVETGEMSAKRSLAVCKARIGSERFSRAKREALFLERRGFDPVFLHQSLEVLPCHSGRSCSCRNISVRQGELVHKELFFEEADHVQARFAEHRTDNRQ